MENEKEQYEAELRDAAALVALDNMLFNDEMRSTVVQVAKKDGVSTQVCLGISAYEIADSFMKARDR